MEIQYFLFVLMIFGMVLCVLFLIYQAKKNGSKQDEEDFAKREEKLMMLYFEVDDMLNEFKNYVANAREIIELEFKRVEAEARSLRPQYEPAETDESAPQDPLYQVGEETEFEFEEENGRFSEGELDAGEQDDEPQPIGYRKMIEPKRNDGRYERALELIRANVGIDEIAEELNLSKNEIQFLLKLRK